MKPNESAALVLFVGRAAPPSLNHGKVRARDDPDLRARKEEEDAAGQDGRVYPLHDISPPALHDA